MLRGATRGAGAEGINTTEKFIGGCRAWPDADDLKFTSLNFGEMVWNLFLHEIVMKS
jgi:hypothetical protein